MREAAFVKRNSGKWPRLEQVVAGKGRDLSPDEASTLYLELNDDLSYARTFYPGAQVTAYGLGDLVDRSSFIIRP